jgi:hypothetical protein
VKKTMKKTNSVIVATALDLTGMVFGRLTVVEFAGYHKGNRMWRCRCACGREKPIAVRALRGSRHFKGVLSCGCRLSAKGREICRRNARALRAVNTRHGMAGSSEYAIFKGAAARCRDPNIPDYRNYGGRGIEFRFKSFEEFYAELGPRPSARHTLDRVDNNGHYAPGNVRWATYRGNLANRRITRRATAFGKTQTLSDWRKRLASTTACSTTASSPAAGAQKTPLRCCLSSQAVSSPSAATELRRDVRLQGS